MTTAVRQRPPQTLTGAVHSNCRCIKCRAANAAWQVERRNAIADGTWQPYVPAGPVREHVEHLHASGLSYKQIAAISGVHISVVRHVRTDAPGQPKRIRPDLAEAILKVQPVPPLLRLPERSCITSIGMTRRIQALRAIGWPCLALADRTALTRRTLTRVAARPQIMAGSAQHVVQLYDELHREDPRRHGVPAWVADRTAAYAAMRRWCVPAAWTDIDADEEPNRRITARCYTTPAVGDRSRNVIADTAELAAAGCDRAEVAARIGIAWESIAVTHGRAGVDIPVRLQQENAAEAERTVG